MASPSAHSRDSSVLRSGMNNERALSMTRAVLPAGLPAAIVLASAVIGQVWAGASPLHPGFTWPAADPRAPAVLASLNVIPPDASLSATSALYPHLSARSEAYWFPATLGAEWLALDTAGASHPLSQADMHEAALRLLSRPDVGLVQASHGVLIAQRQPARREGLLSTDSAERSIGQVLRHDSAALPAEFYDYVHLSGNPRALSISFGDRLQLSGYELHVWPQAGLLGGSALLETYWRATQPIPNDLRFALATTRTSDGALSGFLIDPSAAPLWYPTSRWQPGEGIRLEIPIEQLQGVQALGISVMDQLGNRLPASSASGAIWENGTIAEVTRLG